MVNPQLEDGYIRIATEVWEAFCRARIRTEVRRVIDFVIRKTWGYHKKFDKISLSQFQEGTGLCRPSVHKALKEAVAKLLLVKTDEGYGLNKNYSEWAVAKQLLVAERLRPSSKAATANGSKAATHNIYKDTNTKDSKKVFGDAEYVQLSEQEYSKLCKKEGGRLVDKQIECLENYVLSHGLQNKYKDHYRTLLNFIKGHREKGNPRQYEDFRESDFVSQEEFTIVTDKILNP